MIKQLRNLYSRLNKDYKCLPCFLVLYGIGLVGTVLAQLTGWVVLLYLTKPLLMVALAAFFYNNVKRVDGFVKLVLVALLLSWWGDVFLMFEGSGAVFFLLGLVSFLGAHVVYIVIFSRRAFWQYPNKGGFVKQQVWPVLAFAIFEVGLLIVLRPRLGELLIPVVIYATVIMLMVLTALNRYERVDWESFRLVFLGAVIFMLSDTLIALNKFWLSEPSVLFQIDIIVLYALGQMLIVFGLLAYRKGLDS